MPDLAGSLTHENLKAALAKESEANRLYLYFAKIAEVEGEPEMASLFRDTAEGETGHAHGHLDFLKTVGDPDTQMPIGETELNLRAAVSREEKKCQEMYPSMAKVARDEGFVEIANWFETLAKAKLSHANRFQKGLDSLD